MVLLTNQGTTVPEFENKVEPKEMVLLLESWIDSLHQNMHHVDTIKHIKNELNQYYIIQSTIQDTRLWLLTNVRFVREKHQRPLTERLLFPFYGHNHKPSKIYYHDRILVNNLMNLPAKLEMSKQATLDLNAGDVTPFILKLIYLYESLLDAHNANMKTFSIFSKTDAISNMNELNGWLKDIDSESTNMLINTFDVISLNTIVNEAELCYI